MPRKKVQRLMRSVVILGLRVPVKLKRNIVDERGNSLFGYYDPEKREIVLNKDQTDESLRRTLYHEVGHAFMDRIGVRVAISGELNEVISEGIANLIDENFAP